MYTGESLHCGGGSSHGELLQDALHGAAGLATMADGILFGGTQLCDGALAFG